jgi:hypothetical protein
MGVGLRGANGRQRERHAGRVGGRGDSPARAGRAAGPVRDDHRPGHQPRGRRRISVRAAGTRSRWCRRSARHPRRASLPGRRSTTGRPHPSIPDGLRRGELQNEADELALISWRATRLAGVLGALDFSGPIPRKGEIGSGDSLIHTMRLVAAALCGMVTAAQASANPLRGPREAATAGQALAKAMSALEEAAKDVHRHRAMGELMGMTD